MYLFSYRRLASALKQDLLDESDRLIYLCVSSLIHYGFAFLLISNKIKIPNTNLVFGCVLEFIFIIAGYYINKSGDHKDYIVRYMILDVPVLFQTVFISTILYLIAGFIGVAKCYMYFLTDLLYGILFLHGIYLSSRKV